MSQPTVRPSFSPHQPSLLAQTSFDGGGGVQVRCAGCRKILTLAPGVKDFFCPTCQLLQMLPPELLGKTQSRLPPPPSPPPPSSLLLPSSFLPPQHVPAHGIDPTKIQLPCANCKAILNVPHGLLRFACPQCGVDLAVDVFKAKQFVQEELNEVFILIGYFSLFLP